MADHSWTRAIFQESLGRTAEERENFLPEACHGGRNNL